MGSVTISGLPQDILVRHMHLYKLASPIYRVARKVLTATKLAKPLRRSIGPLAGRVVSRFTFDVDRPSVIHGHKMLLAFRDGYPPVALAADKYEEGTTRLFELLVEPGMVVIDVGAHVGYYSLLAAKQVGPNGKVYAFEPEPHNYELLQRNVALNGRSNVLTFKEAISDRVGSAKLYLTKLDNGRHSTYRHGLPESGCIVVDTTTVDAFLGGRGWPRVDLVKIDVEGAELDVLNGMGQTLAQSGELKLIVEFNPPLLRNAGADPAQFLNRLAGEGFNVYCIDDRQGLIPVEAIDVDFLVQKLSASEGSVNLFCRKE